MPATQSANHHTLGLRNEQIVQPLRLRPFFEGHTGVLLTRICDALLLVR